ncbi:hypothetical protein [Pseudomonas lurida]|uniref:hypothetical protein n=1 Tax=Pseudomonas lurida TaxID=244566 RepID=UPI001783B8A5|nr:hypothetical protein [Pseudomonas lurida]MBD8671613.1 hypothetical protein [Pseudomonas lurida]
MADETKPKTRILSKLAAATRAATDMLIGDVDISSPKMGSVSTYDADYVGIEMLLGSGLRPARSRSAIYQKWHYMLQDGLISTILRLHVQMALGGHETTGETVFIEPKSGITAAEKKLVEELQGLAALFNRIAHGICYYGTGFGDAYARLYVNKEQGLWHMDADLFPPLVQPYEELGRTVGYVVNYGEKVQSRFDHLKMIRLKMPRMGFVPQMRAIENAQKTNLEAETSEDTVPLPALVGGSFLEAAEVDYDNLVASIGGMTGQRISGSIDETMIGANMADMTAAQQETFMRSLEKMLITMKNRAEEAVKSGTYVTSRNFHVMPTWNEKQITQISSFQGGSNSGAGANIEDVMFNARKLSGTLGIDLSLVGYADQMTGGLGEGGFNRTSSQAAERSRIIRTAFMQFCNDAIDRHTLAKYGFAWADSERPYNVNFFGSIAALEAEKQASRERAINTTAILVQVLAQIRDLGIDVDTIEQMLARAELDADFAKQLAKAIKEAKPPAQPGMGGGDFDEVETLPPEQAANKQIEQQE